MLTKMKVKLAANLKPLIAEQSEKEIVEKLEIPKDPTRGDLAFPCFAMAKLQKKSPADVAKDLCAKINPHLPQGFLKTEVAGGFLNFYFEPAYWAELVVHEIQHHRDNLGAKTIGNGKSVAIDYSSPNVAKPMSIGHLRSTVIGQSLSNLFKLMGFKVTGINYLGDWGVQFGKLAWAHLNTQEFEKAYNSLSAKVLQSGFDEKLWKKLIDDLARCPKDSFDYLYALYVVFHACAEIDEGLNDKGRATFLALERKSDLRVEKVWREFVVISLREYTRVYELLGIRHEELSGESMHEQDLPGIVDELKAKNLLTLSQGALIVDLEKYGMPPCLIQKTDGATLYATRDLAAAKHRVKEFKADRLIYVVGAEQTLHFKQFFKVLELMGYEWSKNCVHVPFGLYKFKEGKMSTRRGNVIFLEDVLDRAIEMVRDIIKEKNPDLKDPETIANQVGCGAIIFNDLMNDRLKNIDFDWSRVLDFNGDTGPYVQYTHARCCSVMTKWGKDLPHISNSKFLVGPLEQKVLKVLGRFENAVEVSYEQLKPSWLAQYLLELCHAFNEFYYECRILDEGEETRAARLWLTYATRITLKQGLNLLSIQAPEAM